MTIGSIGKALVTEAIDSTKKSVIDAVTSPSKAAAPSAFPDATAPLNTGSAITGQIQAMQRPLKEDLELAVIVRTGDESLRVTEIFVPSAEVLVFAGTDANGNVTRLITPASAVQVVCKILKVAPGAIASRVNVLTPRPQPKPAA
jgi:hypothetical protein